MTLRLCTRDPHQLFLRLESQVREFVIEMKVKLLKQLNAGYKSPPEAKSFIQLLLDEYRHLCLVSRKMGTILEKLVSTICTHSQNEHIKVKLSLIFKSYVLQKKLIFKNDSVFRKLITFPSLMWRGNCTTSTCFSPLPTQSLPFRAVFILLFHS